MGDLKGKTILLLSYGSYGPIKKRKGAAVDFSIPVGLQIVQADLRYKSAQDGEVVPQACRDDDGIVEWIADAENAGEIIDGLPLREELEEDGVEANTITLRKIDNQIPIPFPEHTFHRVIMRKGLCECHDRNVGCGGVTGSFDTALSFALSVVTILSKEPGAAAYLHGVSKHTSKSLWQKVARRMFEHFDGELNVGIAVNSSNKLTGVKFSWESSTRERYAYEDEDVETQAQAQAQAAKDKEKKKKKKEKREKKERRKEKKKKKKKEKNEKSEKKAIEPYLD